MKCMHRSHLLLVFALTVFSQIQASASETGQPFITHYYPEKTHGDYQTWTAAQDARGVMYFGNGIGLLEYDGTDWRLIEISKNNMVRSMAIDDSGRIYIGSIAEFGYMAPDSNGALKYISLSSGIPDEDKILERVWTTQATAEGIYFQARSRIFRFKKAGSDWKMDVWRPEKQFGFTFYMNGKFFVQQIGVGLMEMIQDKLTLIPGGEQFKNDRLQVMLPYAADEPGQPGQILIGTFNRGLFLYDGTKCVPFKTEVDEILKSSTIYGGVYLSDKTYGFATLDGGFVRMSRNGRFLQQITQESGLSSDALEFIYKDKRGDVWIGPEGSISHIEIPSPFSIFDDASGVQGFVSDITRHNGVIYVSTTNGLFYLDPKKSRFLPVTGIQGIPQSFNLLSVGNELLAAVNSGLYRVKGDHAFLLKKSVGITLVPLVLHQSRINSNRVFIGMVDGVSAFRLSGNNWIDEGRIAGIGNEYVVDIEEAIPGTIWLSTTNDKLYRFTYNEQNFKNPDISLFTPKQGLPTGGVGITHVDEQIYFVSSVGLYRFDQTRNMIEKDTLYSDVNVGPRPVYSMGVIKDPWNNLWINLGRETVCYRIQPDGTYLKDDTSFLRFSNLVISKIYFDDDGIAWFVTENSLIRYDPNLIVEKDDGYNTLVRKVSVGEDKLIYAGLGSENSKDLDYADNAIRFEYSATSYDLPSFTRFQSWLEGFDDHWSSWSQENIRSYTNLPPGKYVFRVRTENVYRQRGKEASYTFDILPPWYRTWWAYTMYILIFAGLVFTIDRVQRRRLIHKEREQSRLREAELRAQTAEARNQTLQLENERKKNVELLSEIGKEITASLSIKHIIDIVYENINDVMDASVFGIGIYNQDLKRIEMPATKEKGKTLPLFSYPIDDVNRPAVWCYMNQKEIFINDYETEYKKYIKQLQQAAAGDNPASMLYLPLTYKDKKIGVITAQSFSKNVYTEYHLNILRNLATYTAIALDNADTYRQVNSLLEDLKSTQQQLITQEKLASLGALTAGIAHEIKNPLNFVNNFAELIGELVAELKEELIKHEKKIGSENMENINLTLSDLEQNARKINEHGHRADSIIRSMLQHSRGKKGEVQATDINAMLEEDLNLAYHGMRAQDSSFNATIEKAFDESIGKINVVPQDISRVFLNILTNGFYEVHKKRAETNGQYAPKLIVRSQNKGEKVLISIKDNGNGIPPDVREKLFNPFFTTKPTGKGTGLGLSISYDILVHEHKGDIKFETELGEFTEFIITLPVNGVQ
jgi:signal transduction histidine kinase/heme exporter protein D